MSKKPPYPINNKYPPYDLGDYDIQMSTGGATPSSPQVVSPSAQATDSETQFLIAYECAKVNREWDKVRTALMEHPDWLTRVPTGRSWTMLHQIVFSGDTTHLNEVLALQAGNASFRLMFTSKDGKTVRDVAAEREHIHTAMLRRIDRLILMDELLNNAKSRKWDLVKQSILANQDIVNEKPPYRRYYLAHHLAVVGQLDIFKELTEICHFNLTLTADGKTVSQVARAHNKINFAEYVEELQSSSGQAAGSATSHVASSGASGSTAGHTTLSNASASATNHSKSSGAYGKKEYYGTSHDNDISMSFISPTVLSSFANSASSHSHNNSYPPHGGYHSHNPANDQHFFTHSLYHGGHTMTTHPEPTTNPTNDDYKKSVKPKPTTSKMTAQEENAYEETIMKNLSKMSQENLLSSITCCITKTILRDPVVAADGFTYERDAITKWFETSNRSPMTNQELDNLELKPNFAIKSILQSLQGTNQLPKKSDKK